MAARGVLIFVSLTALVAVTEGFQPRRRMLDGVPTAEECMRPPMKRIGRECCSAPREKIWGDLKSSMDLCFSKFRQEQSERQETAGGESEMATPEGAEEATTDDPTESAVTAGTSPSSTSPDFPNNHRRPHFRKKLSERVKDFFGPLSKELKNTFDALWQSVVIITDHFRRHPNDSCFMECVFEDQGFLVNRKLNKEALLTRLSSTLGGNEPWHKAAVGAFEICYSGLQVPSSGSCMSGSEEVFRCTFKQLFFNCPNWAQTPYCTSLKEFYQKCPNGPPPEMTDSHTSTSTEEDAESSVTTARYTTE